MIDEEKVFEAEPWWRFVLADDEALLVQGRCPECMRFIKAGRVEVNGLDQIRYVGWICKKHGEVNPNIFWESDTLVFERAE